MLTQSDIDAIRAAAEKADMVTLERIISAYGELTIRLQPFIDALQARLETGDYTSAQVEKLPEFKRLIKAVEDELEDYSAYLAVEVKADIPRSAGSGLENALFILALALGISTKDAATLFNSSVDPLGVLAGYLEEGSPLMERIRGMAGFGAESIRDLILEGVGLGKNPLDIARMIVEQGLGVSLTSAMRWTRTAQLYSYRWATASIYQANSDVVKGWIWWAELDDSVCMSCVSLHGKVFALEDGIADDHYNGRCAMIPYIPGATDEFANPGAGKEWFDGLSEQEQRAMMGAGKYEEYNNNSDFNFDALSKMTDDPIFGTMRVETSLSELMKGME